MITNILVDSKNVTVQINNENEQTSSSATKNKSIKQKEDS